MSNKKQQSANKDKSKKEELQEEEKVEKEVEDSKTAKEDTHAKSKTKSKPKDQAKNKSSKEKTPKVPDVQEVEVEDPNLIRICNEDNDKAHWYVVHTYSGREKKVAETLKQRANTLNLGEKIIKVLIPTKEKIQIKKGKRKTITEKIFPGYMLVNMIMDDDAWLAVRTTQGVTGFVGASSRPSPIPKYEVEAITKYAQQATPQYKAEFSEGEAVKITDGPFNEFLGTVQSIDESKAQVSVLINIFGRETPVELDFLQVEKV